MNDLYELAALEARQMVAARYGTTQVRASIVAGDEDQYTPVFNALLGVRATLMELRSLGLIFDTPGPFTIPHDGFIHAYPVDTHSR